MCGSGSSPLRASPSWSSPQAVRPGGQHDLGIAVAAPDAGDHAGDLGELVGVVDDNGQLASWGSSSKSAAVTCTSPGRIRT